MTCTNFSSSSNLERYPISWCNLNGYVSNRFMVEPTQKRSHSGAGGIMARVFRNSMLSSHLHAAPSTNIYLRILYCCVRREAVPPFSSSLSHLWSFLPGLSSLSPPFAVTLLSACFFSWGKLLSCWPGSLPLHSPPSPHVAVEKHPGERHLSSSLC